MISAKITNIMKEGGSWKNVEFIKEITLKMKLFIFKNGKCSGCITKSQ
jgi:hypothetical protein